jgi:predicted kinase
MVEKRYVVVSGPPASGKSTMAPELARGLALPLLAKDTIKDALMELMPVPDIEASRRIGGAAVAVMLAVAAESPVGAVLESTFFRSKAVVDLARLPGSVVEVFCRCRPEVAGARYTARAGSRGAGHFDHQRRPDELWNDEVAEPVGGAWPVIEVDTNEPVDTGRLLLAVRAAMIGSPT